MNPEVAGVLTLVGAFVAGLLCLWIGWRILRRPSRASWHRVAGTVVAWTGGDASFPIVEYPLPDGTLRRFRNRTTTDFGSYRTGHLVPVLVNPADPTDAELASTRWHSLMGGCAFLLLGGTVLAVAVTVAMVVLRSRTG